MSRCRTIALLGRRDEPTDAIEEYCRYLALALTAHGFEMQICRVPWNKVGWAAAFSDLQQETQGWRDRWVLVQYTALAWSKRGFPSRFLRILEALQKNGARVAVVFHDVEAFGGRRLIDRVRRWSQLRVMRAAEERSLAIFTVPLAAVSWRPNETPRPVFVPVGANFPEPSFAEKQQPSSGQGHIAVYGVTGGAEGQAEIREIADAVRGAAQEMGPLKLTVLGRNSTAVERNLREALGDASVELQVLGVLPPEDVARALCRADVLLFVRGEISTRRGSAIAGIACGLPVVAFAGAETAPPITEAGLALYKRETPGDLSRVLTTVLRDAGYRASLSARSRAAHKEHFSWSAIAARYAELLRERS
jgi:glycosyltransferase involved in cell wall biosynthesis